jgi:hypothetical protein
MHEEEEEEVTSLLLSRAFEMSTTSHQMNNNELNEFKPSFNHRYQIELLFSPDTKFVGI